MQKTEKEKATKKKTRELILGAFGVPKSSEGLVDTVASMGGYIIPPQFMDALMEIIKCEEPIDDLRELIKLAEKKPKGKRCRAK